MLNTKNCIISHPIENLDINKWQALVNLMAELFDSAIAQKLKLLMRETDTLARIGGDEFVIVMNAKMNNNKIKAKLLDGLKSPILYNDIFVSVSASIGFATYPDDGETMAALLAVADTEMYRNKTKKLAVL